MITHSLARPIGIKGYVGGHPPTPHGGCGMDVIGRNGIKRQLCAVGTNVNLRIDEQPPRRAVGPAIQYLRLNGFPRAVALDDRPHVPLGRSASGKRYAEGQWSAAPRLRRTRAVGFRQHRDARHDGFGIVIGPWTDTDRVS